MEKNMLFSLVGAGIASVNYIFYIVSIYKHETKPNFISWFIWALSNIIIFIEQVYSGSYMLAFCIGTMAFFNIVIFLIALKHGNRHMCQFDKYCLAFALLAILLVYVVNNPFLSVVLALNVGFSGLVPTILKTYAEPFSEKMTVYYVFILIYIFGLLSIEKFSYLNTITPVFFIFVNAFFVMLIMYRRHKVETIYLMNRPKLMPAPELINIQQKEI